MRDLSAGTPFCPLTLHLLITHHSLLTHVLAYAPTIPLQDMLLGQYTKELHDNFGISFNELFTITNMPVLT